MNDNHGVSSSQRLGVWLTIQVHPMVFAISPSWSSHFDSRGLCNTMLSSVFNLLPVPKMVCAP